MARKKKAETGKLSGYEMDVWLAKTEKRISNIQYGKDFENLKIILIKLLSRIKKEPFLMKFEPRLVLLLKDCNLNLQFIRRNEDCWILLKSGHSKEALEEIIHILKDLNAHPDKYLVRPDIKGLIVDSVKKISEKSESEVKILPKLNLPKSIIKTIKPSISKQTTGNTFKPKIEDLNPFDISAPIRNPFEYMEDEKMVEEDKQDKQDKQDNQEKFETYFRPKNLKLNENEFDLNFAPFPKLDKAQKLSEDQVNSINTYWSKEGEEGEEDKEEKIQRNNSPDAKTQ